jgi:hypothetical protein
MVERRKGKLFRDGSEVASKEDPQSQNETLGEQDRNDIGSTGQDT